MLSRPRPLVILAFALALVAVSFGSLYAGPDPGGTPHPTIESLNAKNLTLVVIDLTRTGPAIVHYGNAAILPDFGLVAKYANGSQLQNQQNPNDYIRELNDPRQYLPEQHDRQSRNAIVEYGPEVASLSTRLYHRKRNEQINNV